MSFFTIKIISTIHISCFKKVLKIDRKFSWFYLLKVSFSGHFLPTQLHLKIWYEHMLQNQPDYQKLILDSKASKIKSLAFSPIFLTKSSKKLKMGFVQDSHVEINMILNVGMIYHMKVYRARYGLGSNEMSKSKIHVLPIY